MSGQQKMVWVSEEAKDNFRATIEKEGAAYAFLSFSNFEEIKDVRFHALRVKVKETLKKMAAYTGVEMT